MIFLNLALPERTCYEPLASTHPDTQGYGDMMDTAKMRAGAQSLADEVRAAEQAEKRRSWRKVTTVMSSLGIGRLTPAVREALAASLKDVGLDCEPGFDVVPRSGTVRLSLVAAASARPTPGPGLPSVRSQSADSAGESVLAEATLWSRAAAPQASRSWGSRTSGSFLVADVDPGADPEQVFATFAALAHGELTVDMVADLLDADEVPKVNFEPGWNARVVSSFGAHVDDEGGGTGTDLTDFAAGTVSFEIAEMIVGSDWMLMCWHNSVKLLPNGGATDAVAKLRGPVLRAVEARWVERGTTAADLALLISLELMGTHQAAQPEITSWLEVWESSFAEVSQAERAEGQVLQVETQTLSAVRRALREYRKRLQAQDASRHSAVDRKWLPDITIDAGEDEMKSLITQATRQLDATAQALRGATELLTISQVREQLQLAHRAQKDAELARAATEREQENTVQFQNILTVLGAILLGPGLIAAFYGANVDLPGRDRLTGTIILTIGMVLVSVISLVAVLALQRRHRPPGRGRPSYAVKGPIPPDL